MAAPSMKLRLFGAFGDGDPVEIAEIEVPLRVKPDPAGEGRALITIRRGMFRRRLRAVARALARTA